MANSGIIAPPIIDIGIRIAQPAALVDCSFRPMAATSIMMPTKAAAADIMARSNAPNECTCTWNTSVASANMIA